MDFFPFIHNQGMIFSERENSPHQSAEAELVLGGWPEKHSVT